MADLKSCLPLTRESVVAAHDVIKPHVHRTPLLTNKSLNEIASMPRTADGLARTQWAGKRPARPVLRLWFKCENLQRVGAFKVRGAFHALERLKMEPGWIEGGGMEKGVVSHSSGNHAQALALAAREMGMPAYIVMPKISNRTKVEATRGYDATISFSGATAPERQAAADQVASETGARLVPPYDHPDIILGQGTVGLEIQDQFREQAVPDGKARDKPDDQADKPDDQEDKREDKDKDENKDDDKDKDAESLDAIMVPCGGGGLMAGIALSCEGTPVRVYGAEPNFSGANDVCKGFASGKRIEVVSSRTVADGLRTPIGVTNWEIVYGRRLVAAMFSVPDSEIMMATRMVMERMKLVVEPSAAVALAVALFDEDFRAMVEKEGGAEGWDLGIVLSGGNVDLSLLSNQIGLANEAQL